LIGSHSPPSDRLLRSFCNGCDRCYNIDINALYSQGQHFNVEQVLVKSYDETIGKENDNLKLKKYVKKASQGTIISR
jgi:hypothetical protein